MKNIDYKHLEKNISDMIYEGMVKLGDKGGENVSIFYDNALLCYLLGLDKNDNAKDYFDEFKESVKNTIGEIDIKPSNGRFQFTVNSKGTKYIYDNNSKRTFLKDLIKALNERNCTLADIIDIFKKENENVIVEEIDNSEFQYVIYFADKNIDEFRYCFTFDSMGKYYHRLLEYDFDKIVHDSCCKH